MKTLKNIRLVIIILLLIILTSFYVKKDQIFKQNITPTINSELSTSTLASNKENISAKITYKNATADLIFVDLPYPLAVTGKEFSVIGKARGNWFFEASFPVKVLDKDGKLLATGIAEAKENWMTTSFVSFEAKIKVPESYIGEATLILEKDNPSGLEDNNASMSFPFTIEY